MRGWVHLSSGLQGVVKHCAEDGQALEEKEKEVDGMGREGGSICQWVARRAEWSDNAERMGYAPTLTLANRDLPCHKYVQAPSHQETLAPSHFSSKESEVIRADVQP